MATIPLSIARYVREVPSRSPHPSRGAKADDVKKTESAQQLKEAEILRYTGTPKRFQEYLNDPLIKESGRSSADGLLTSQGEARVSKPVAPSAVQESPSAKSAVLESNSLSLMAALGAEVSHKNFSKTVQLLEPAQPVKTGAEKTAEKVKEAAEPALAKQSKYESDPSVQKASEALQRRMLQLDPNAEKWARDLFIKNPVHSMKPSGRLSAVFESGNKGIEAIGYDRTGGTSYGKYQIASRPGTMDSFIKYLEPQEPQWADKLRKAGPANTGSRKGEMPKVWKEIAKEHPKRFEQLQDAFILQSHYEPALKNIMAKNMLNLEAMDPAIKEVLLSTSVQHGPNGAAEIFSEAVSHAGSKQSQNFDEKLIKEIYESRSSDFPSSSRVVQQAVRSRLMQEESLALTLLDENDVKDMF